MEIVWSIIETKSGTRANQTDGAVSTRIASVARFTWLGSHQNKHTRVYKCTRLVVVVVVVGGEHVPVSLRMRKTMKKI